MATPIDYAADRQLLERAHSSLNRALEALQEVEDRGIVAGQALTDVQQAQSQVANARRNTLRANLRVLVEQRTDEEARAEAALQAAQDELQNLP